MVAILSDRRVQILNSPDNALKQRTEAETISYLTEWTSKLRVPDPGTGKPQPSNWSFDIKQYSINQRATPAALALSHDPRVRVQTGNVGVLAIT